MVDGAVMGIKIADRIGEEAARGMKEAVKMTEGNVMEMVETCRVILEVFKVPAITAKIQQSDNSRSCQGSGGRSQDNARSYQESDSTGVRVMS